MEIAAAVVALMLSASPTEGRAPACFPERTVLHAAELSDASGFVIGGIRAGHSVRVLRDEIGPNLDWAEIEITEPVHLKANLSRRALHVFARRDLPVVVGWHSWAEGVPLSIESFAHDTASVRLALPLLGEDGEAKTACSNLTGTTQRRLYRDGCYGAIAEFPVSTGNISWDVERVLESQAGGYQRTISAGESAFLVRTQRAHVLVDVYDGFSKFRGWADSTRMNLGPTKPSGRLSLLGCCPGRLLAAEKLQNGVALSAATTIRTGPVDGQCVTIPEGATVFPLRQSKTETEVMWLWPDANPETYTFALKGWIPSTALPSDPKSRPNLLDGAIHGGCN